jgi:N-methylhydantoinase A
MAFGAAGPMMLPPLLDQAHVEQVLVPPYPGHFSALGLLSGYPVYADSRTAYAPLAPSSAAMIEDVLTSLAARLKERVPAEVDAMTVTRSFDARLYGQSSSTPFIEIPDGPITPDIIPTLIERFHDEYESRNGNAFRSMPVEAVTLRVQIVVRADKLHFPDVPARNGQRLAPRGVVTLRHLYGKSIEAPEYHRAELGAGDVIEGPAIVREPVSTTLVSPDQRLTVGRLGEMVISRSNETANE